LGESVGLHAALLAQQQRQQHLAIFTQQDIERPAGGIVGHDLHTDAARQQVDGIVRWREPQLPAGSKEYDLGMPRLESGEMGLLQLIQAARGPGLDGIRCDYHAVPDAFVVDDDLTLTVGVYGVGRSGILGKAHAATIRRQIAGDKIRVGRPAQAGSCRNCHGRMTPGVSGAIPQVIEILLTACFPLRISVT
jgi:hypothetical protein